MKTLLAITAAALALGGFAGCAGDKEISRGGPREDWNSTQSDPVCKMTVNPKTAYTVVHGGNNYYFDTAECARKFRDNPTAYSTPGDGRTDEERRHHREVR